MGNLQFLAAPGSVATMDESGERLQRWENCYKRVKQQYSGREPYAEELRIQMLLNMCPLDLSTKLMRTQHHYKTYEELKNHIEYLIQSETQGPTPMHVGNIQQDQTSGEPDFEYEVDAEGELNIIVKQNGKKWVKKVPNKSNGKPKDP